jgi:putative intracellular protease/amidase
VLSIAGVVTTSCGRLPWSRRPTGTSLPQVAIVTDALRHVGWTAVMASPLGGTVPVDPADDVPEWAAARAGLTATTPLRAIEPSMVGVWIVLGGPGALGDLADDAELATLLQGAAADGAIVMAVDHGAGALAARPRRGDPLATGRRVTGPSDAEARRPAWTAANGPTTEQRLRAAGGCYSARAPGRPHIVVDGHLITAQNTASIGLAVAHVLAIVEPWRAVA